MPRVASIPLIFVAIACSPAGDASDESEAAAASAPTLADTTPGATDDEGRFRYTSLANCTLLRSAPEEGGFFEHECPGEGGYRLRHVEADLRENIVVLSPDGTEHGLGLPALANGAFSSTGDTVEWRGEAKSETFVPRALIVRQSAMEDPNPAVPEVSYLVVAKLGKEPCVVARIAPGPDQNERARAAADAGGECLDISG